MARKIRVTESELVAMIETIITTEKRDKNVIKLSEGDLNKIIKKVNEKIHIQEEVGVAATKGTAYGSKGTMIANKIKSTYMNRKLSDFITYTNTLDEKGKGAAVLEVMGLIGLDPAKMSTFTAAAKQVSKNVPGATA
tara:strand:+ start:139 stop:549 length:411 start_codon:yes stop_codon:yes gene_type:complete